MEGLLCCDQQGPLPGKGSVVPYVSRFLEGKHLFLLWTVPRCPGPRSRRALHPVET